MNKEFRNYPRRSDIDAYGVDLLNYKGQIQENTRLYTMARYAAYKVGKANAEKIQSWAEARRAYDRIQAENDRKMREYNDRVATYDKIVAHNASHPESAISLPALPRKPKLDPLPELKKQPKLAAIPMLRYYEPGKAPLTNTANA